MADDDIVIKVKKIQEAGHGGGAWKIAYADFVTAMMAFFLLLWLLNATEQEVLEGVSNYFQPTLTTESGGSGSGGMFGGITANDPGPSTDKKHTSALDSESSSKATLQSEKEKQGKNFEESTGDEGILDAEVDAETFNSTQKLLETALQQLPEELENLKDSILIDITDQGLRLQIVDQGGQSSFIEGTDTLTDHAKMALKFIANFIGRLPNEISVSGHVTSDGEQAREWLLSSRRANAARRELSRYAIDNRRFRTMIGKGASEPLNAIDPQAEENRRVSIVMIKRSKRKNPLDRPKPPSLFREKNAPPPLN